MGSWCLFIFMYWSFAEERERGKKDSLKPSTESSVLTPCNISGYLIGLVMGQKTNKHKKEPIFFSFVNQLWLRPDIYQPKIILLTKLWLLFYFCRDLPVVRSSLECWWFHSQIGVRKVGIGGNGQMKYFDGYSYLFLCVNRDT